MKPMAAVASLLRWVRNRPVAVTRWAVLFAFIGFLGALLWVAGPDEDAKHEDAASSNQGKRAGGGVASAVATEPGVVAQSAGAMVRGKRGEPTAQSPTVGARSSHPGAEEAFPVRSSFQEGEETYQLLEFPIDLERHQLAAVDLRFEKTLEDVAKREDVVLAFNGGYWDVFREPEGLLISESKTRVGYSPSLGGGILEVRKSNAGEVELRLWDGEDPPRRLVRDRGAQSQNTIFAIQCSPRLVVDGQNNIRRDDGRRAARTALGIRDGQLVVLLSRAEGSVTGREGPSLFGLARELVVRGYDAALNLDGGPSSGAVWNVATSLPLEEGWDEITPIRMSLVIVGTR